MNRSGVEKEHHGAVGEVGTGGHRTGAGRDTGVSGWESLAITGRDTGVSGRESLAITGRDSGVSGRGSLAITGRDTRVSGRESLTITGRDTGSTAGGSSLSHATNTPDHPG